MSHRRWLVHTGAVMWAMAALASAGLGACTVAEVRTVVGLVLTVEGDTPASVASFTLRTDDGVTLGFVLDEAVDFRNRGFPGAHLREHQALGQPVRVTYRVEGSGSTERLIVVRLEDVG